MIFQILINVYFVIIFLVAMAFVLHFRRRLKYDKQRYQLFKVRDDLYRLAANNKVDQASPEYKFTEEIISSSILAVRKYDLFLLIDVLKNFDRLNEQVKKHQTLFDTIKRHKQLSKVYKDFTCTTMTILYENSLSIKILTALHQAGVLKGKKKKDTNVLNEQPSVDLYRGFAQWNHKFA